VKNKILTALSRARRSIDVAMYSFSEKLIVDMLKEKAADGVRVRVLLNLKACSKTKAKGRRKAETCEKPLAAACAKKRVCRDLTAAGITVRWVAPSKTAACFVRAVFFSCSLYSHLLQRISRSNCHAVHVTVMHNKFAVIDYRHGDHLFGPDGEKVDDKGDGDTGGAGNGNLNAVDLRGSIQLITGSCNWSTSSMKGDRYDEEWMRFEHSNSPKVLAVYRNEYQHMWDHSSPVVDGAEENQLFAPAGFVEHRPLRADTNVLFTSHNMEFKMSAAKRRGGAYYRVTTRQRDFFASEAVDKDGNRDEDAVDKLYPGRLMRHLHL
jgi:phosphatidylserine/phosphatidylglycerophosphate/cardiolipin synthase-like enzyme